MNYPILYMLLSIISGALSFAFLFSMGVASYYDSSSGLLSSKAFCGFSMSMGIAALVAIFFFFSGRNNNGKMFRREALAVIGTGWILASLIGGLPYWLILPNCSFSSAFFESASGLTTTGASVLSNLEELPRSLLFWRSISQWIGGLGVIVFFVAIMGFLGAGAKILFSRESSAQHGDLDSSRVQTGIYRLLYFYLGISLLCAIVYHLCGLNWYDSFNHMFATISTGGFSTRSASIADFDNALFQWVVILFMVLGGTSFPILIRLMKKDWNAFKESTEIKAFYGIIAFSTLVVTLFILNADGIDGPLDALRHAMFQVVSIITTTGFATQDFNQWLPATHMILLLIMIVGGCSGSTGGGVKVFRVVLAFKSCVMQIEKTYRSNVVRPMKFNGKNIQSADRESTMSFLVLMTFVTIIGCIVVALLEPEVSLAGSISAVFACIFNIGPGFAEVGPSNNFAFFGDLTKWILSLLMILGRLELLAILALFSPSMWKKF